MFQPCGLAAQDIRGEVRIFYHGNKYRSFIFRTDHASNTFSIAQENVQVKDKVR